MPAQGIQVFQILLLAHLLADFVFQSNEMASRKRNSGGILVLHAFIAGLVSYVIFFDWSAWGTPLLVFASHWLIDTLKVVSAQRFPGTADSAKLFIWDQISHIAALFLIALCPAALDFPPVLPSLFATPDFWNAHFPQETISFLLTILLAGPFAALLIAELLKPYTPGKGATLVGAGKLIGYMERFLIILFILFDHWECIGFLLAAKSLLRFNEAKAGRKRSEYVLLGTFLSVFIAILCSLLLLFNRGITIA